MSALALVALMFLVVFVFLPLAWLLWHAMPGWAWLVTALLGIRMLFDLLAGARRRARLAELKRYEERKRRDAKRSPPANANAGQPSVT